jgi:hypothetical protein
MFKKSFIALSLVAASAAASASTGLSYPDSVASAATPSISVQGWIANKSTKFTPGYTAFTVSSAGDLANVNAAAISLSGAGFADASAIFSVVSSNGSVELELTPKYTFGDANNVTLSGFSSGTGLPNGYDLVVSNASFTPDATAKDSVSTMTLTLSTAISAVDTATATLGKFVDQFSVAVSDTFGKAGEKVDVQADAKALTVASDSFAIKVSDVSADYAEFPSAISVAAALTGDFSWALDASGNISGSVITADTGYTITSSAQKLAVDYNPTSVTSTTYTLTASPSKNYGNGVLSTGAYGAEVTLSSGTTTLATQSLELGSWDLNGSDVAIPYMPFGTAYANAISVTNTGTFSGDIMVSFTANGETTDLEKVGVSTAKSVVNVGSDVAKAAIAKGLKEAQVNVVVKAPSGDINVTAIYYSKADADRVKVN